MNINLCISCSVAAIFRTARATTSLLFVSLAATCAQAASVESLSKDELVPQGDDAYWQATVKCEGSSSEITIKQQRLQQDWCIENNRLPCAQTKMDMAIEVCLNLNVLNPNEASSVASQAEPARNPRPTATTPQLKSEQQSIQRQARAELAAAIRAQELTLQAERRSLEAEKRAVERAEQELSIEERQLEEQLRELES